MPFHQVFLPPRLIELDKVIPAHLPIRFRDLPRPFDQGALSQSLEQSQSLLGRLLQDRGRTNDVGKGKRKATAEELSRVEDDFNADLSADLSPPWPTIIDTSRNENYHPSTAGEPSRAGRAILQHAILHADAVPVDSSPTQATPPSPAQAANNLAEASLTVAPDISRRHSKRLKHAGESPYMMSNFPG
jgi:hypothetical protein